jgi:hypothetical protein
MGCRIILVSSDFSPFNVRLLALAKDFSWGMFSWFVEPYSTLSLALYRMPLLHNFVASVLQHLMTLVAGYSHLQYLYWLSPERTPPRIRLSVVPSQLKGLPILREVECWNPQNIWDSRNLIRLQVLPSTSVAVPLMCIPVQGGSQFQALCPDYEPPMKARPKYVW